VTIFWITLIEKLTKLKRAARVIGKVDVYPNVKNDKGSFMKSRIRLIVMQFFALFLVFSIAKAQPAPLIYDRPAYSQAELEQMLAPVALYPDSLLSHVLMASTYPTEVVEASYWLRAHPELKGDDAIRAAETMQWDISVKSLLPFPHLLDTMESRYEWMRNMGDAFLGQQAQVMDTIQVLRHRAMVAGHLRSDGHVSVIQENRHIAIMPVQPTLVFVPYYNPRMVYGRWPQPAYAPVVWDPWPGYVIRNHQTSWTWSPVATVVTAGVLFAIFDWNHHHVYHRPQVTYWQRHPHYDYHKRVGTRYQWRHDPRHRRDVPYHHSVSERRYGGHARSYNKQVPPRPTVREIRSNQHRPQPVHQRSIRDDDHRKPMSSSPKVNQHYPDVRKNDAPRGVAHGVRQTQPSASQRPKQEARRGEDRRQRDNDGDDDDDRRRDNASKERGKRGHDSDSRDDNRRR